MFLAAIMPKSVVGQHSEIKTYIVQIAQPGQAKTSISSSFDVLALEQSSAEAVAEFREYIHNSRIIDSRGVFFSIGNKFLRTQPTITVTANNAGLTILKHLQQIGRVDYIQEEKILYPTDADAANLSLHSNKLLKEVQAAEAWTRGYLGEDSCIAIFDTGIHLEHPVFEDKILDSVCFSVTTYEHETATSLCEYDTDGNATGAACTSFEACTHGTAMAGVAAGNDWTKDAQNFEGGVAKRAKILAYQVFREDRSTMGAVDTDILAALEDVLLKKRTGYYGDHCQHIVINLSLASIGHTTREKCHQVNGGYLHWFQLLRDAGIMISASAGNLYSINTIPAPACVEGALSASWGGVTQLGEIDIHENAASASWGNLFASGTSILSAGFDGGQFTLRNIGGSSSAAAALSGFLAVAGEYIPQEVMNRSEDLCAYLTEIGSAIAGERMGPMVDGQPGVSYDICFPQFTEALFTPPPPVQNEDGHVPSVSGISLLNYPNPFSELTTLQIILAESTQELSLTIYDMLGRQVTKQALGPLEAGTHTHQIDISTWSAGQYVGYLKTAEQVAYRLLTVVK